MPRPRMFVALASAALLVGVLSPSAASADDATPSTDRSLAVDCGALAGTDLSDVLGTNGAVTSSTVVGDGAAGYCRVLIEAGGATKIEARLPLSTWNGRYLQLGCGGMCGAIRFSVSPAADTSLALGNTFVVAATNEGHDGAAMLAGGHTNELRADYGHRANHWTAVAVKHLIELAYGEAPAYSYFQGYSDGGRAAIQEAQRYPEDFDGIIAGAPAIYTNEGLTAFFIWRGIHAARLDAAARQTLAAGAMALCDPADGVADGQISDPRSCDFDPGTLACTGATGDGCLSADEIDAARKLYEGPRTTNGGGKFMHPGGLPEGSELNWPTGPGPVPTDYGRYLAFWNDPGAAWTWEDFEFTVQTWQGLQKMADVYNADNGKDPDLRAFDEAGGKLMVWYGLADASTGQDSTLDWYAQVQERSGGLAQTREFARVFQVPGLYHGGGYVDYQLQMLPALMDWVERGVAPESLTASASRPVERTYPVYAYPARAQFTGHGDVDDATNWTPVTPAVPPVDHFDWLGNRYARER